MILKSSILSLEHMCCQVVALPFWQNEFDNSWLVEEEDSSKYQLYTNPRLSFAMRDWIAKFHLPELIKQELHAVGMALGQAYFAIVHFYDFYVNKSTKDSPYISSLQSQTSKIVLSPMGGINEIETIRKILQNHQSISKDMKISLAEYFYVHDQKISKNLTSYLKLLYRVQNVQQPSYKATSFLDAINHNSHWAAKYIWSQMKTGTQQQMSQRAKHISDSLDFNKYSRNEDHFSLMKFLLNKVLPHNPEKLLDLIASDINVLYNFVSSYLEWHSSPIGGPMESFVDLLEQILPEDKFNLVIKLMMENIICNNRCFLYPWLQLVWARRTDSFKDNFRVPCVFGNCVYVNIKYVTKIILLFKTRDCCFYLDPLFLALAVKTLLQWREPLELLDEHFKQFVASGEILNMKEMVLESCNRLSTVKHFMTSGDYQDLVNQVHNWTFETR